VLKRRLAHQHRFQDLSAFAETPTNALACIGLCLSGRWWKPACLARSSIPMRRQAHW
jgi:hypothetical protein